MQYTVYAIIPKGVYTLSTSSSSQTAEPRDDKVLFDRLGSIALLTLSNPKALNAMTWHMYETLTAHLDEIESDDSIRVVVMRGDGDKAFAAGTDIKQFESFTGADGVNYEQRIDRITRKLVHLTKPTIAAVHGYAIGGGLILAAACDLRYVTPRAQFGAPIARTLGNCLSIRNCSRLALLLGETRLKDLIFTARLMGAEEAVTAGFVTAMFEEAGFFERVVEVASEVAKRAPLTLWATKTALSRLQEASPPPEFDDVVERVYGSRDFHEGVRAHLEKRSPNWEGC